MRALYVVTHPEATHHVDGLVGGWSDSVLTERGRVQAEAVAVRLRELVPADAAVQLWSSDLRRATQTAEIVGRPFDAVPLLRAGLREKSYGEAEGRPQAWLDERFVPPPVTGDRLAHHEGIAGSETRGQLGVRAYAALAEIRARPVQHQIVVTHGFTLTMLVAAWIGMPLRSTGRVSFGATSGGLTILEEDDHFHNRSVVRLDDTAHLRDL